MKRMSLGYTLALLSVFIPSACLAQTPAAGTLAMERIARPAEPLAIPLYQSAAPGSEKATYPEVWTLAFGKEQWVRNVTRPTLTPFLPAKGKETGTAVLVIPGGGFQFISISNEGWPVAQWFADRGIAAFVLKYRVEQTDESEAAFAKAMMARFQAPRADAPMPDGMAATIELARADAQTALRMIRGNAGKWNIDPAKIGMVGFSAGAMTTLATTLANDPKAMPAFVAPIYGPMEAVTLPAAPPPMFAALAADDALFGKQGFGLIESWTKAGGSAEMHFYAAGGHGFGAQKKGTTSDLWFDQLIAWMKAKGF